MTVNIATAVYKSTGSTTGRSLGARAADIINVKDYGATGNGVTDDAVAIQAAFDAAFGPWNGTPNGNTNRHLNIPVFFPAGEYLTHSPLYLKEVVGGLIYGEGSIGTEINFLPFANGNAIIPNPSATVTGSIGPSSTTLTVTAILTMLVPQTLETGGTVLSGTGVTAGTAITAQLTSTVTGTHGVANGTTTFVDATANAFTAAMVGSHLQITAGITPSTAVIVQFVSASTVILNFNPGSGSGVTWKVNGWTGTYTVSPSQTASSTTISAAAPGAEITPCIMTNGYGYVRWAGISLLGGVAGDSTNNTTGFYYYSNSNPFIQQNAGTSTACRWTDMEVQTFYIGMLVGYGIGSGANQENCVLTNVTFHNCPLYGLRLLNQNVLNWISICGGGENCGTISGSGSGVISGSESACYSCQGSGLTLISPSMSANGWDVICNATQAFAMIGGSSESLSCLGLASAVGFVSGFSYRNPGSLGCNFIDVSNAALVTVDGCFFSPGGDTGVGVIITFGAPGQAIIDNLYIGGGGVSCQFSGSGEALLWYRGQDPIRSSTNVMSGFTGRVAEWNTWTGLGSQAPLVGDLPAPSAIWKGVRQVVTDSTVVASGNFGAIVAGTSTHTVPVFCDGTNWLIG